jgi:MFS family permease
MPLYAVLAREYFGPHIMGTVFGAATMTSSVGMAFGRLAGGWVLDTFGQYGWLYIGISAPSASGSAQWQWHSPSRRCRARHWREPSLPAQNPAAAVLDAECDGE